ncbi:MAG: hypothetical protein EOO29_36415, partial [Comamonadaceae bacterium]
MRAADPAGMKTTHVLVDGPVEGDFRLLRSIRQLQPAPRIFDISASDISSLPTLRTCGAIAWLVVQSLAWAVPRSPRILRLFGWRGFARPLAGLPACLRWLRRAVEGGALLRAQATFGTAGEVHAHDLYCGVAAIRAALPPQACLVYDSHELQ